METRRTVLRRFRAEDFEDFAALIRDKMASPWAAYDEQFPTDEGGLRSVLSYFVQSDEFFAVERKDSGRVVGYVSLNRAGGASRNLGFCIHSAHQRQGLASEAASAIIGYARELAGVARLQSGTAQVNLPAVRLLRRLGFRLVGEEQASFTKDKNGHPVVFTGCLYELPLADAAQRDQHG